MYITSVIIVIITATQEAEAFRPHTPVDAVTRSNIIYYTI